MPSYCLGRFHLLLLLLFFFFFLMFFFILFLGILCWFFLFIPGIGWRSIFFQIKLSNSFLQSGVGERPFLEKLRHALRFCMLDLLRHQSKFAAHDVHEILWLPHLPSKMNHQTSILPANSKEYKMSLLGLEIDVTDESGHLAMCILCLFGGGKSIINSPGHREIVVEHVGPLLCWAKFS